VEIVEYSTVVYCTSLLHAYTTCFTQVR